MYALRIAGGTPIRCAPAANACSLTLPLQNTAEGQICPWPHLCNLLSG